jgi:hypothetical protein
MASRVCPKCHAPISAAAVAAKSDNIECPNCHTRLEGTAPGRMLGAWAGMAAAFLAWSFSHGGPGPLGGALPLLYAVLAFGAVAGLVTMLTGDVKIAPELPVAAAAPAHGHDSPGHGASHGGGAHH